MSFSSIRSSWFRTKRWHRWVVYSFGAIALLILLAAITVYVSLRRSLPVIDGEVQVAGLTTSARIERDALGTPTIRAHSREDLAFATGFAHAQDRLFQMDLLRRSAAGELSALLGESVIAADQSLRLHRFRTIAQQVIQQASETERDLLSAYAQGVNAGADSLDVRPWEYLLLRTQPEPWLPEDSVLAGLAMYLSLNDSSGTQEIERAELRQRLHPQLFAFLHPIGTEWDAPLVGRAWRTPPVPGPDVIDLRRSPVALEGDHSSRSVPRAPFVEVREEHSIHSFVRSVLTYRDEALPGSNSWAVASRHTKTGGALLANDMHLGLRLPNVWYPARLVVDAEGPEHRDLTGVTLPGLPMVIVGSNTHVAWGYTNSYGDWTDLVLIDPDPRDATRYLTADGSEPFAVHRERIEVRGADAVELEVRTTRWGPVIPQTAGGQSIALAWTAHHPRATNLRMLDFEQARSVEALLASANQVGAPVQNVIAVDHDGRIGWSLMGQVPVRASYDSTMPSSWATPSSGWTGWRQPHEYPRIIDPPSGRLWTANARPIDATQWFEFVGEGDYDLGARAAQIRDALLAQSSATPASMAALQVDDRALFLMRWRDLALELVESESDPTFREARDFLSEWSGRAAAQDVGYRITRAFRDQVRNDVYRWLTGAPDATAASAQFEGPLWALIVERPKHLLSPAFETWEDALRDSLKTALEQMKLECGELRNCTWGANNRMSMRHPLSSALPFGSRWLDMPEHALDGDAAMPRVQAPTFGASQRLVVSPGRESEGLFQMPGGPVAHPLSPFYGAGHEDWVRGAPRALLPGDAQHSAELVPR
jgi:penicillin amidase